MSFLVGGVREDRFKTPLSGNPPSNPATAADPNDVSNASGGKYRQTLKKFDQTEGLDRSFTSLVFEIQHRLELVAHVHRVRLERWLRKLHEPVRAHIHTAAPFVHPICPICVHLNSQSSSPPSINQSPQEHNETWKRNRNNHARLMLACLKMGRLEPPFDKHPKDGRLDMLPPHALLAIKTSSEARKLERAAGTRSDWVTDPGIQGSNLPPDGGGSPGLGFKSSSYTAVRGGAPIPGPRDPGRNAKNLEEMLQRTAVYDDDVVSGGDATCTRGPASRVKDVLDIKGDMRDWLGKGAKGEVAVRELAAQKERTKAVEMKLDATEMKLKLATDELQRLRDGMVRQQKRHAEEMADLQRAHQKEMSVFAKLVEVSFTFEGI